MVNDFTPEMMEKAKKASSPLELLVIAKDNGVELTAEQASVYFEKINKSGELSDDELDNVSGGGCRKDRDPDMDYRRFYDDPNFIRTNIKCPRCGGEVGKYVDSVETILICVDCGKTTSIPN